MSERFVFLDDRQRLYRVDRREDGYWLSYWSRTQKWVTLKKVTVEEAVEMRGRKLPEEHAKLYDRRVV